MTKDEALQILGITEATEAGAIKTAIEKKKADIQNKISSAPTDALQAKFQQLLDKVIAAEQVLNETGSKQSSQSRSPLSETKMADLPGAGPVGADSSAQSLQVGTTLAGRYEIKEQIGAGGMGAVYHAFDTTRNEDIAIKVLLPHMVSSQRAKERFLNEARISSKLSHPNIVNVFDVQEDGDKLFLTMELLDGQDLRALMENRKLTRQAFDEDEARALATTLCDALSYAHEYTVHRDIKPENIWVTEDGQYKLMDFGIARVMSNTDRTQTGMAMGTAYYMAPEQLKGTGNVDGRADQYALGVLLYELLNEEVPAGRIKALREVRSDLSKPFAAAIDKTLEPKPEDRFADMAAFCTALNAKSSGLNAGWALPTKTLGIAAGVIAVAILLVVLFNSGAFNNLEDMLPQSAEELAAQKAEVAKLQGEIKTYKRRLENGRRQLDSDLRDASRNNSADEKALEHWQTLTDNYIFNGSVITELEGDASMGESLLRDDNFERANITLTKVRDGYKNLWEQFNAAENIYVVSDALQKSLNEWLRYKKNNGLSDSKEFTQFIAHKKTADQLQQDGDFVALIKELKEAAKYLDQASIVGKKLVSAKSDMEKSREKWLKRKKTYQLSDPKIVVKAKEAQQQVDINVKAGDFMLAVEFAKKSEEYWKQASTAGKQLILAKENMENSRAKWLKRKKAYHLTDPKVVVEAKKAQHKADMNEKAGDFTLAIELVKKSQEYWKQAYLVVSKQVAAIDTKYKEIAAEKRKANEEKERHRKAFIKMLHMVDVPGGHFRMRSGGVTVKPFAIGKYEVTQKIWQEVMGSNPSHFKGCSNCPVENVSWDDIQLFITKINQRSGKHFRLPTESEWEYACLSGAKTEGQCGSGRIHDIAWFSVNSDKRTHPVGQKNPNELGLFDMNGNVMEWVQDCYNESNKFAPRDGSAWESDGCGQRVYRGGSWSYPYSYLTSDYRDRNPANSGNSNTGFRLAL